VLAFFQGNRFLVDDLVGTVRALVSGGTTLLDLYAGVGLFSVAVAPRVPSVVAMEGDRYAVADAKANARDAGLSQVKVVSGEVLDSLRRLRLETGEAIILDPPRRGAGPGVVEAVVRREPACVVYVSCDPPTLGRDLALFQRAGFHADAMHVFDLFPDTLHLETVIRLRP
jgi:23S rRNA (uracil1939-C5)-methyltransferase